jgi:hypothetical protein
MSKAQLLVVLLAVALAVAGAGWKWEAPKKSSAQAARATRA